MKLTNIILTLLVTAILTSCGQEPNEPIQKSAPKPAKLFTLLDVGETGVHFSNDHTDEEGLRIYNYINYYSGSGVAIGDINNDGLPDIYFTGNEVDNKLFLNKGNLQFEDITERAGVGATLSWCTGVNMADVNNDGFLDIYVCRSYADSVPEKRKNLLFMNNGDMTFTEQAEQMGVADGRYSIQSSFFDFDNDGDLDLFVGNHPRDHEHPDRVEKFHNPTLDESDGLYRNDGDKFTDVTEQAGITNWAFLLGVATVDLNDDGLIDIYRSNDHGEPDQIMINNGDGTFTDQLQDMFKHISNFAMGIDIADYNNDGFADIVIADMNAADNYRQKTLMSAMDVDAFWKTVDAGYHYQYMRNTLQLNNGNGTYSEIGQLAGISNSDWSWAPLLADFDNDADKDLFITNGNRLDYRNQDFRIKLRKMMREGKDLTISQIFHMIPSQPQRNFYFENNGSLQFDNRTVESGFNVTSFSNGAAYGDLDNDGDLDLVVNNIEQEAFVLRNNSEGSANYLRMVFEGPAANPRGYNTRVTLHTADGLQFQEFAPQRGFQSCMEHVMHFGLGNTQSVEQMSILWPDGREQVLTNIDANQELVVRYSDAAGKVKKASPAKTLLVEATKESGVEFLHQENDFDDYEKEILLPHRMSTFGPKLGVGDINGDGLDDFYVCGAATYSGALYLSSGNGFRPLDHGKLKDDKAFEDVDALVFNANGDDYPDLYIASGGAMYKKGNEMYQDRLFLGKADGFELASDALPIMNTSSGCVEAADFDNDGDLDLFVGGRLTPGEYPFAPRSYLLRNTDGVFEDVTEEIAPGLVSPGLVSSAVWTDHDGDEFPDLVIAGEWMQVTTFTNNGTTFEDVSEAMGLKGTEGLWFSMVGADMDGDGDKDLIAGNYGLNSKFTATPDEPLQIYCHDFDESGTLDIVLGYYNEGICYPVRGRQCSSEQMPNIKKKFPSYHEFASSNLEQIYGDDLKEALHLQARTLASVYLERTDNGYEVREIPLEAQFSTVFGIVPMDIDHDGRKDLVIGGNFYAPEVETGRNDASIGTVLRQMSDGSFEAVAPTQSGFFAGEDVRDVVLLNDGKASSVIAVGNNSGKLQIFRLNNPKQGI